MSLIAVHNAKKTFENGTAKVVALDSISFEIEKGEMVAIVGPSGSGKSTLLNIIGLLEELDAGNYKINNIEIKNLKESERSKYRNKYLGFIVQHFALINDFSVYDNVEIPLEYGKVPKSIRKEKIKSILERLGIGDKINTLAKKLSGGQCQRVAIARALINDPEIILADEPTGALDTKTGQEIIDILKEINSQGKTVIIITHDHSIANQCNRIITLVDGKITSDTKNK